MVWGKICLSCLSCEPLRSSSPVWILLWPDGLLWQSGNRNVRYVYVLRSFSVLLFKAVTQARILFYLKSLQHEKNLRYFLLEDRKWFQVPYYWNFFTWANIANDVESHQFIILLSGWIKKVSILNYYFRLIHFSQWLLYFAFV